MNKMPHAAAELPTLTTSREGRERGHVPGTPIFVLSRLHPVCGKSLAVVAST